MAATRMSFMAMILVYPFVMVTENGVDVGPRVQILEADTNGIFD